MPTPIDHVRILIVLFTVLLSRPVNSQTKDWFSALPHHKQVGFHLIEYPDSSWVAENKKVLDSSCTIIPLFDITTVHWKSEYDIYVLKKDSLINLSERIKKGRRGQLTYKISDKKRVIMVFDAFVPNIDSVEVRSDSPVYDRLFSYSELWAYFISDSRVKLIDMDEGEYEHMFLKDDLLTVDVKGKYKKDLYVK